MDTNAPAPKPDMLEQAGGFLRDFIDAGTAKREPGIVPIAAALLAVAAELRDIHNVLHEINQLMQAADSRDYVAESVAIFGSGS